MQFRIDRTTVDTGICLLIKIDEDDGILICNDDIRPDYLVLHLHRDGCICTIVEMKGGSADDLRHGVKQITSFAGRLRREFAERLPGRLRIDVQGILLTARVSQAPGPLIARAWKEGVRIKAVQYSDCNDLFNFVSSPLISNDSLPARRIRNPRDRSFLERILATQALRCRIAEPNPDDASSQSGLRVDYLLGDCDTVLSLRLDPAGCAFRIFGPNAETLLESVQNDLVVAGLESKISTCIVNATKT